MRPEWFTNGCFILFWGFRYSFDISLVSLFVFRYFVRAKFRRMKLFLRILRGHYCRVSVLVLSTITRVRSPLLRDDEELWFSPRPFQPALPVSARRICPMLARSPALFRVVVTRVSPATWTGSAFYDCFVPPSRCCEMIVPRSEPTELACYFATCSDYLTRYFIITIKLVAAISIRKCSWVKFRLGQSSKNNTKCIYIIGKMYKV